jgi:AraC family transcriptional regulator, positive regulator of tynA and feaB
MLRGAASSLEGSAMERHTWSTHDVPPPDRFSYWADAICQAVVKVEASVIEKEAFSAEISCNRLAFVNFVRFRSTPHNVVRTRRLLSSRPDDRYLVSYQISGKCHIEQESNYLSLGSGDIGIITAARSVRQRFEGHVRRVVAVLPRSLLESECGWLSPNRPVYLSSRSPTTRVLSRILDELAGARTISAQVERGLGEAFVRVLAASQDAPDRPEYTLLNLERVMLFVRANLTDPELSPGRVARQLGMSERTLHGLFQGTGSTFSRWLWNARLDRAATALRSTAWEHLSITNIAFRHGFNDLSHFSRRFSERFGCSARAYRLAYPRPAATASSSAGRGPSARGAVASCAEPDKRSDVT